MSLPGLDDIVRSLGLSPHPEGGFYRETYRAPLVLDRALLGDGFGGDRAASTAIYFLIPVGAFSALHRIASDEVWHFYAGAPLTVTSLDSEGVRRDVRLGIALDRGEVPQAVIVAGAWFGARIAEADEARGPYALVGCTVAPGFDFADFELGERASLLARFPAHAELVTALTRT